MGMGFAPTWLRQVSPLAHKTTLTTLVCECVWVTDKLRTLTVKVHGKVKVHTLDIAPLRIETPPQKRSGMARVLKGSHSFTCTSTHVQPQSEWYSWLR